MAELGHQVLAIDVDDEKIIKAARGEVHFFEPGLEPLLRKNIDAGRLRFTSSWAEIGEFGQVHFLCVGTPQAQAGNADLRYVRAATDALAAHLNSGCLIVGKSTVPVGTARELLARARAAAPAGDRVDLAWNPEFLREGHAVQDCLTPDRLVFGVTQTPRPPCFARYTRSRWTRASPRWSWAWRRPSSSRWRRTRSWR
jgi:UDPglucose 6-dehydrogenase